MGMVIARDKMFDRVNTFVRDMDDYGALQSELGTYLWGDIYRISSIKCELESRAVVSQQVTDVPSWKSRQSFVSSRFLYMYMSGLSSEIELFLQASGLRNQRQ